MTSKAFVGLFIIFFATPSWVTSAPAGQSDSPTQTSTHERAADAGLHVSGAGGSVVSLVHQSRERVAAGDLNGALAVARSAVAKDPAFAGAWKQLGRVLMLGGDYTAALPALATALDIEKDDPETQAWIIRSFKAADRLSELVAHIESLPVGMPGLLDDTVIASILERLMEQSDDANAEKLAQFWEKAAPQAGAKKAAAALIQVIRGDRDEAEALLSSARGTRKKAQPLGALVWSRLGLAQLENHEIEKAIFSLEKAHEWAPDWLPALRELGWAYRRAAKPALAADTWNKGLDKNRGPGTWLEWIVEARIEAGQFQKAEAAADRLLKVERGNRTGRIFKLACLLLQKKDREAMTFAGQLAEAPDGERMATLAHVIADKKFGRYADAARRLEEARRSGADDPEIIRSLVDCYTRWAASQPGLAALEPLRKLIALQPEDKKALEAWDRALGGGMKNRERFVTQVVATLAEQGFGAAARDLFRRWEPEASLLSLGLKLGRAGRLVAAGEMLAAAWEQRENQPILGLGPASIETGQLDTAVISSVLERLMEQPDSGNAEKVARLWAAVAPQAEARNAAAALIRVISGNPDDAEALLSAADVTIKEVRHLIALAWNRLGLVRLENHESDKAIFSFGKSLELAPNWLPALRELGWAYRRAAKPALAADTWNMGLEKNPRLIPWLEWIVGARVEAGQLAEAEATADRVLQAEPGNRTGLILKLACLLLQKKDREAMAVESQLAAAQGGELTTTLAHAVADTYSGRYPDAVRRLEDARRSGADDPEITALLVAGYSRLAAVQQGIEALEALQQLVALQPEALGAWRDLGWSLWENKQHQEAIAAWDRAIRGGITNHEPLVRQIVAYLAEQGYGVEARELFLRWEPDASPLANGLKLVRDRRFVAAREMLAAAWEKKENPAIAGLYLAYSEARTGVCAPVPEHIAPFIERGIAGADQADVAILLGTVEGCSFSPGIFDLVIQLEKSTGDLPRFSAHMTAVLEKAANERRNAYEHQKAFLLYGLVLKHDTDRPGVWFRAYQSAEELGREQEAIALLKDILSRSKSVFVLEGIKGRLSDLSGNLEEAVNHYRNSLNAEPNQPELRHLLFGDLLSLRRFQEARNETDWFVRHISSGDLEIRSILGEMYSDLEETAKALEMWQELYLTYPETPSYALETAKALFAMCRAEEAIAILKRLLSAQPYVLAYELLAEIDIALGRPLEAVEWATKGLALQPSKNLLRLHAEVADVTGQAEVALQAAAAVLEKDPGDANMARLAGRALLDQNLPGKGKVHNEALLKRNASFQPALKNLRILNSSARQVAEALSYAERLAVQRPWDANARLEYAISLAEANKFKPALRYLRADAKKEVGDAIPVLVYDNVTYCPYPGRVTSKQAISHLERLAAAGYSLNTPDMISAGKAGPRVVVVINNAEEKALQQLDTTLEHLGGKAIFSYKSDAFLTQAPGTPAPAILSALQANGRWLAASNGLKTPSRMPVDSSGRLGNALTHRIMTVTGKEDGSEMAARLDAFMKESSAPLAPGPERIFVYPGGDYGHLSLDADPQEQEELSRAVGRYFNFAIAADDYGFIGDGLDPHRLPGRFVPPSWDDAALLEHLTTKTPYVQARLGLGKVLYMNGQNERANAWFSDAAALGADAGEVNYHWGNNAYAEGDLPVALKRLRLSRDLDPESKRNERGLERVERTTRFNLDLSLNQWEDSDDRRFSSWGGEIRGHVSDTVSLSIFANRDRWDRTGVGSEEGTRAGGAARWFFADERWLDVRLWNMHVETGDDHVGGIASVHLANPRFGGHVDIIAARELIDTVEAVRSNTLSNRYALETYSRLFDAWDLFADLTSTQRTDGNDTVTVNGLFMRRFHEWPFVGAGYKFVFADSDRDPAEYWAPQGLQKHQIYATSRGEYHKVHYTLSAEAGYADETSSEWRFVWSTRLNLDYWILDKLQIYGRYSYQETPTYKNSGWLGGIKYVF